MSEVTLTILDSERAIYGNLHGSVADQAIAALAAEPETIEELDVAMRRFTGRKDQSHFGHFSPGDSDEPWDAGVVIIDLAARLIAGESTYSAITTEGSVLVKPHDVWVNFRLSDDWEECHGVDFWRGAADKRREARSQQPPIDTRAMLFGRPMLKFITNGLVLTRSMEADQAVKQVHADWLMTVRQDLGGKTPREVLLERNDFLSWDNQYREHQWSMTRECPLGLERTTAAYKYAGFGTNEIVVYYDLMRFLLWECRERINQESELNQTDEVRRLERLQDAWLDCPNPDLGGIPATMIDNERRRIPEGTTGADSIIDPDCPCCQMMAEEDFGPMFWHLDGSSMDDEFAFSFYKTRQEWDDEQQRHEEFNREFERKQAQRQLEKDEFSRVWKRTFVAEQPSDDMPLSQFVPIAMFGFAAMVGELNEDIGELADDEATSSAQQETLNRLLGNIRNALSESAELIDPTLDRLVDELADLADKYPVLSEKSADLTRRLQEFPSQLAASATQDDMPF